MKGPETTTELRSWVWPVPVRYHAPTDVTTDRATSPVIHQSARESNKLDFLSRLKTRLSKRRLRGRRCTDMTARA